MLYTRRAIMPMEADPRPLTFFVGPGSTGTNTLAEITATLLNVSERCEFDHSLSCQWRCVSK